MSQYLRKPYRAFAGNAKFELDLSNYETKTDLIEATEVDSSNFALKSNLASLKTEVNINRYWQIKNSSC